MCSPDSGKYVRGYRFLFNGKESDSEWQSTSGSIYDYGFRIYNPRIGKFLSVDPLTSSYPMLTPYQFASNTPIQAIDLDGQEAIHYFWVFDEKTSGWETVSFVYDDKQLKRTITNHFRKKDGTWESKQQGPAQYDWQHISKRIFRPRGIQIYGYGSPDGENTGTPADYEDVYGSFDFKSFMEIIDVAMIAAKSKQENSIGTSKYDAVEKTIEVFNDLIKEDQPSTTNNQDIHTSSYSESGDTIFQFTKEGTLIFVFEGTYENSNNSKHSVYKYVPNNDDNE